MKFELRSRRWQIVLLILLLVIAILVRLHSDHQTDFDSYWLHGMAESIQLEGYAPWILHPTSLLGYYPLSYPSGTPFFLAMLSSLTGLSMNATVFLASLLVGLCIVFFTFVVAKKLLGSWMGGFLAALMVALSPTIINYTAFNVGGRVLILFFYLPLIWSVFAWQETKSLRYLLVALLAFAFSLFAHRTGQLILIFVIAFILAYVIQRLPAWWEILRKHPVHQRFIKPRYKRNRFLFLLDVCLVLFALVIAKLVDLILRNRLTNNLQSRVIEPGKELIASDQLTTLLIVLSILLIAFIVFFIYVLFIKKRSFFHFTYSWFKFHYHRMFAKPEYYFLWFLLFIAVILFVRQFFGASFYSPSLVEYQSTKLLSGNSPLIIFANMVINYSTAVTPLFILSFVGFIALLFKKKKSFGEWFLIFSFIGFIGLLLDKKYVRFFITPLLTVFAAYGTIRFIQWCNGLFKKRQFITVAVSALLILLIVAGVFMPYIRVFGFEDEQSSFTYVDQYWETGQYIRSLDCDCSTVTTQELRAGVVIFASSGVPGASHNIYYYVDRDNLQPQALSFDEVRDKIKQGKKVEHLWYLPDWIFGGQYYIGRHARYLFNNPFYDQINKLLVNEYNEQYYIHDKDLEGNDFLTSIEPVKNRVFDAPRSVVYSLEGGR